MLDPEAYGISGGRPLENFFGDNRWVMEFPSTTPAQSGKGPDNRRTNFVEALLNDWQDLQDKQAIRDLLKCAWKLIRVASACHWFRDPSFDHQTTFVVDVVKIFWGAI